MTMQARRQTTGLVLALLVACASAAHVSSFAGLRGKGNDAVAAGLNAAETDLSESAAKYPGLATWNDNISLNEWMPDGYSGGGVAASQAAIQAVAGGMDGLNPVLAETAPAATTAEAATGSAATDAAAEGNSTATAETLGKVTNATVEAKAGDNATAVANNGTAEAGNSTAEGNATAAGNGTVGNATANGNLTAINVTRGEFEELEKRVGTLEESLKEHVEEEEETKAEEKKEEPEQAQVDPNNLIGSFNMHQPVRSAQQEQQQQQMEQQQQQQQQQQQPDTPMMSEGLTIPGASADMLSPMMQQMQQEAQEAQGGDDDMINSWNGAPQ